MKDDYSTLTSTDSGFFSSNAFSPLSCSKQTANSVGKELKHVPQSTPGMHPSRSGNCARTHKHTKTVTCITYKCAVEEERGGQSCTQRAAVLYPLPDSLSQEIILSNRVGSHTICSHGTQHTTQPTHEELVRRHTFFFLFRGFMQ